MLCDVLETHRDDGRQSFYAPGAEGDVGDNLLDEARLQKDPVGVVPELKKCMLLAAVALSVSCQSHMMGPDFLHLNIWIEPLNRIQTPPPTLLPLTG